MRTTNSWTGAILEQINESFEPWMSCDECFDRSDGVLEDTLDRGRRLPPDFRAHLAGCAACREEIETLAELAAADRGIDPADVLARLDADLRREAAR